MFFILAALLLWSGNNTSASASASASTSVSTTDHSARSRIARIVGEELYRKALEGESAYDAPRKNIITLIDYTRPSNRPRLFVADLRTDSVLYATVVAHGQGSGDLYAEHFSDRSGSHMSSLGYFITQSTYIGRNGYSLRLNGLQPGINGNALERAIVIHPAAYANEQIAQSGRLGRSWGCPALPENVAREIIDTIKNGTLLYIHGNYDGYNSGR